MKFPVVVIYTTAEVMEPRLIRNAEEFSALIERIEELQATKYEVYELVKSVTRTVEWKESAP